MLPTKPKNHTGHVIGVGGIVIRQGKVLMVQHNYGHLQGQWLLPGGHVDPGENLDAAIEREVLEETGIRAQAGGIVAIRSLILPDSRVEVYVVFLMDYRSGQARANSPAEIAGAGYFTPEQIQGLSVTPLAGAIIKEVLERRSYVWPHVLPLRSDFIRNAPGYRLYLENGLEEKC